MLCDVVHQTRTSWPWNCGFPHVNTVAWLFSEGEILLNEKSKK